MLRPITSMLILHIIWQTCAKYETPQFGSSMKDVTARFGNTVSFTCHVKNLGRHLVAFVRTEPTMLIAWQHRLFTSRKNKYSIENVGDDWILRIHNVNSSDEGIYMCQINTNPMIAQIASLVLQKPPKINKKKTTHDIVVREGANATLVCMAEGSPKPTVSWQRKDNAIIVTNEPDGYGESVIHKDQLMLYRLNRLHMGEYICLASNGIQPEESWSLKIHVHFRPEVTTAASRMFAMVGSNFEIYCNVEAWPRPQFSWTFEQKIILTEINKFSMIVRSNFSQSYQSQAVLLIKNLQQEDYGLYRCIATNEYGYDSKEIELREQPIVNPISTTWINEDNERHDDDTIQEPDLTEDPAVKLRRTFTKQYDGISSGRPTVNILSFWLITSVLLLQYQWMQTIRKHRQLACSNI